MSLNSVIKLENSRSKQLEDALTKISNKKIEGNSSWKLYKTSEEAYIFKTKNNTYYITQSEKGNAFFLKRNPENKNLPNDYIIKLSNNQDSTSIESDGFTLDKFKHKTTLKANLVAILSELEPVEEKLEKVKTFKDLNSRVNYYWNKKQKNKELGKKISNSFEQLEELYSNFNNYESLIDDDVRASNFVLGTEGKRIDFKEFRRDSNIPLITARLLTQDLNLNKNDELDILKHVHKNKASDMGFEEFKKDYNLSKLYFSLKQIVLDYSQGRSFQANVHKKNINSVIEDLKRTEPNYSEHLDSIKNNVNDLYFSDVIREKENKYNHDILAELCTNKSSNIRRKVGTYVLAGSIIVGSAVAELKNAVLKAYNKITGKDIKQNSKIERPKEIIKEQIETKKYTIKMNDGSEQIFHIPVKPILISRDYQNNIKSVRNLRNIGKLTSKTKINPIRGGVSSTLLDHEINLIYEVNDQVGLDLSTDYIQDHTGEKDFKFTIGIQSKF